MEAQPGSPVPGLGERSQPGTAESTAPSSLPPAPFQEALHRSQFGKFQLLPSTEICSPVPSHRLLHFGLRECGQSTRILHSPTTIVELHGSVGCQQNKNKCVKQEGDRVLHPGSESEICLFSVLLLSQDFKQEVSMVNNGNKNEIDRMETFERTQILLK